MVWALAAASAVFWGLRLSQPVAPPSVDVVAAAAPQADAMAMARFLGAPQGAAPAPVAGPTLASRFSLAGVVADGRRFGAALIAIDGKPARPYRVGATLEDGLVLISVERRRASLGPDLHQPASLTLELPPLQAEAAAPVSVEPNKLPAAVGKGRPGPI